MDVNAPGFLGETIQYWIEVKQRIETDHGFRASELISEIAELRAKVSFYESRIKELTGFMQSRSG